MTVKIYQINLECRYVISSTYLKNEQKTKKTTKENKNKAFRQGDQCPIFYKVHNLLIVFNLDETEKQKVFTRGQLMPNFLQVLRLWIILKKFSIGKMCILTSKLNVTYTDATWVAPHVTLYLFRLKAPFFWLTPVFSPPVFSTPVLSPLGTFPARSFPRRYSPARSFPHLHFLRNFLLNK